MVNITINGRLVSVPAGSTILQAARHAGIDIPTLCDHPALTPVGACRICVVEVKGQRTLITACTFPISEGMEIQTESPQVIKARKLILDLLFSERNHYCPFCEASGNCELQNLGYRYGIDHWVFETFTKRYPIDASHEHMFFEHNRCVLCGRCLRGCSDLAANHTLGLGYRGKKSMVMCDTNLEWGDSSCISCGTCLQLCPTGAIAGKRSSFMGRDEQTEHVKSVCSRCSVGCGMEIVTRGGNVLGIKGDWDSIVSGGLLCKNGRFDPLYDQRERITSPMVKRNGKLEKACWDEALQSIADRIRVTKAGELGLLTSSNVTNEALYLLSSLFSGELMTKNVGLLIQAAAKPFVENKGTFTDIKSSDIIIVVGADPVRNQPVASFLIKRAVDAGVRLIVVDDEDNGLEPFAFMNIKMADIGKAIEIAVRAEKPAILYGPFIPKKAADAMKKLAGKAAFISLNQGVNTHASIAFGLNNGFNPAAAKLLYIIAGEDNFNDQKFLQDIDSDSFAAVQASFLSPLTDKADVVLPMAIWSERAGSLTNTEGRIQKVGKAVEPQGEAKPDWEILALLAEKLGRKPCGSLDELTAQAAEKLK